MARAVRYMKPKMELDSTDESNEPPPIEEVQLPLLEDEDSISPAEDVELPSLEDPTFIENEDKPKKSRVRRSISVSELPALLEPFKYNWKRKIVYRTPTNNKSRGTAADIVYISPDGRKFWNSKKLKQHLTNNPNGLKINNFTYTAQPIGVNDETKEMFDYSRRFHTVKSSQSTLVPLEKTSTPNEDKIKQSPTNHNFSSALEISNMSDEFESSSQMNSKRKFQSILNSSQIKRAKVSSSSSSLNNSIGVSDLQNRTVNKVNRFEKYMSPKNSMQALIDYHKSLQSIFSKLEVADLLRVRLVCTTWRDIADKPSFWSSISTNGLKIHKWNSFAHFLEGHKTKHLNMKGLVDIDYVNWDDASSAIAATNVTHLELSGCSAAVAEKISQRCMQLRSLSVTLLNCDIVNLNNMDKMNQHYNGEAMQVSYESLQGINLVGDIAPLLCLSDLSHLTLKTLTNLTTLKLGEGLSYSSTNMQDLRYLRLEQLESQALISFNIIDGISSLTRLEHLELIDFDVEENFDEHLQKCIHLKSLMLIPSHSVATSNRTILKGILSLKPHLKYVIWGVHMQQLKKSKDIIWKHSNNSKNIDFLPILEPVPSLHLIDKNAVPGSKQEKCDDDSSESVIYSIKMIQLTQLEKLISLTMPNTIVSILKTEKFRPAELSTELKEPKFYTVFT